MKSLLPILIFLVGASFWFSCSNPFAGGGPSGSEAGNALAVRLVYPDGSAAAEARVSLRPADFVAGDTILESWDTSVDDSGNLHLDSVGIGDWFVEVQGKGKAWMHRVQFRSIDSSIDLGIDTLQSVASITGLIEDYDGEMLVFVPGTDHVAQPDSSGYFVLDSLPAGAYAIQAGSGDTLLTAFGNILAGESVDFGTLVVEGVDQFLLDNFEDGDTRNRLAPLLDGGWWWLDYQDGGFVTVEPDSASFPLDTDVDHGQVAHFKVEMDSTAVNPWLDLGVQVGLSGLAYDFSGLDSLVFLAKGTGEVVVTLHPLDTTMSSPQYQITLPVSWTRVSISIDSLLSSRDPLVLSQITAISWVFTSSAEFWLDDVTLVGVDWLELFSQR